MSKNTRTRIILTAVAALLLVVMTVGGTIAYLQDKTELVTNTFDTSNLDITLQEHEYNETDNTLKDTTTSSGQDNYQMVPGKTMPKDPFVTVAANSEKLWLFVQVADNSASTYLAFSVKTTGDDAWTKLEGVTGVDNVWYMIVDASDAAQNFYILTGNEVTVKNLTNTQMDDITDANKPSLQFTAYAVQYDYIIEGRDTADADAAAAWAIASGATKYGQ